MIDPQKLIEQFLGGNANAADSSGSRSGTPARSGGGSPLDALPDSLKGFGGGLATGGLAGILLGTKGGRKMAKKAVKVGGLAVLGGLAYKAYTTWQDGKTAAQGAGDPVTEMKNITPKAEGTPFLPAPQHERNELGMKLLQAMIAAAKADVHIDAEEQKRIFARLDEAGLDAEEKGFLMDELRKPLDIDAIVSLADSPEQAVEIYAASCMAIDPDDPAEQAYLAMLSARLKLAPELKAGVEREVAAVTG
jgi:uncharacterized membrane protein YebE (DUF533 family)